MRLTVTQENLHHALSLVARVATPRNALPILANVLLTAEQGKLTLAATNLELATRSHIGGKVTETGSITVPARLLQEFVASLPKTNVELSVSGNALKIDADGYSSTIHGMPAEDFPSLPKITSKQTVKLKADLLKTAIQQTAFAASNDESRQVLTGGYLHSHEGYLYLAATDSYRLAERRLVAYKGDPISMILPTATLNEALRLVSEDVEEVELLFEEGQVLFKAADFEMISRLIDGTYPDYRQLLPSESESTMMIFRSEFINITKVSSLFARESAGSITLHIDDKEQEVSITSVASQVGENTSRAAAQIEGGGSVTLNSRYLLDALSAFSATEIKFQFSGKLSPCLITPVGDKSSDYLHVVMPLRS